MSIENGKLSENWHWLQLGKLITKAQYGLSKKADSDGHFPILRMTNQINGKIIATALKYVNLKDSEYETFKLEIGDILFNRTNSYELVGRTALFDLPGKFVFASYLIRVTTNKSRILPDFLTYYLNADQTQTRLKSIATRAVSQSNISATRLKGFEVPVPSINEQKKIAYVLSTVQRAIAQQEQLIQTTRELKKALMHKLFTEGLHREKQKETSIGLIPESWKVTEIGNVFKFSSGKTRPKDTETNQSEDLRFPVYGGNGILGYSSEFLIEKPVLILGRVGEYCGCAHHTLGHAWISDNALYVKHVNQHVSTYCAREYFEFANLNQYSSRAGQPLITQGIIGAVKMPLPPKEEQEEILKILQALQKKIDFTCSKRKSLTDLFRTLLHQLMTAQVRVHDIDLPGFDESIPTPIAQPSSVQ